MQSISIEREKWSNCFSLIAGEMHYQQIQSIVRCGKEILQIITTCLIIIDE